MSKKGSSLKGTRWFWNKREEEFLMNTMKELVIENDIWKLDCGQFKGGFYRECEKKIILHFSGIDLRGHPHIDSKIKTWRKQYKLLQDMLQTRGFGWDNVEKMVLVDSDDVWDNYVKRVSDAKEMRNKRFPYYDDWFNLFGKDRANGDRVEGPSRSAAAMNREDTVDEGVYSPVFDFTFGHDMDFSTPHNTSQSAAPPTTKITGKKMPRSNEGIQQGLAEMAKGICHAHDMSNARKQVNDALQALPHETGQLLRAATMIVNNPKHVGLFFSLAEDDKLEWTCMLLHGLL